MNAQPHHHDPGSHGPVPPGWSGQGGPAWWSGPTGNPPPLPPKRRRGKGVWVVIGGIALLIAVGSALGPDEATTGAADNAPAATDTLAPASSDAAGTAPVAAGIGDTVRSGEFEFTVTAVEPGRPSVGEGFLRTEAQGEFVVVRVGVRNIGGESATFSDSNQLLIDSEGREFEASTGTAVMSLPDSEAFLNRINPGNAVDGALLFDVPVGLRPAVIELRGSMFSRPATVTLS